ncbi:uncharacterized protein LOC127865917 isoform X1 [Dreissena polymorpha]|nr:uncharacterized protein LOC127865917 isoform X1 [Dreissena polymorpha]XP_052261960.1 uncharacterized protein LOC127865917 isoform X1 [Dreissena polymorpha]XP_052261961.1 uncharacterized protein LOC127865917 isoform X1 [Dreissena polymorpha]XP_052261962.1 uncharacterized protein LOC127865917 isoform X1 [Dreissena polymorpha]
MQTMVPVGHVVVSALTNLFTEESEAYSYQSLDQSLVYEEPALECKKCLQERYHKRHYKNNRKGKKKQNRANTPIIIQLKDTLKAAVLQKQRGRRNHLQKQESNDAVNECDVETDNSSDKSDTFSNNLKRSRRRKNSKNINSAFINVVQKQHKKWHPLNVQQNYNFENPFHEKLVAEYVLNNVSGTLTKNGFYQKRNIVECENVEVICNDLNSVGSTQEDTEESEISSITSSSEIQSDSDISTPVDAKESSGSAQVLSAYELHQLATYATGYPLVRYDGAPVDCPECQWYSQAVDTYSQDAQYWPLLSESGKHQTKKSKKLAQRRKSVPLNISPRTVEFEHISNSDSADDGNDITETKSQSPDIPFCSYGLEESKSRVGETKPQKSREQLMDIKISSKLKSYHSNKHNDLFLDGVFVDLTDTDVTFSVYYHHNMSEFYPFYLNYGISPFSTSSITGPHHHSVTTYPSWPYYQNCPYWSPYYMPMYTVPMSFCLEMEDELPKTAMVPPAELEKFNSTHPPQRQWIPLARPDPGRPAAIFTVMCYNVLCDKYCTRQQYGYCPSWALNWEYRKKGIMDEIRNCAADIIGLQEVETDQFYNFFKPKLEREGYEGIFSPKSRARTMTEQERKHVDGCAIFFRTSKFTLLRHHLIEFNQLAMANAEGSDEMLNRVMTKDNIGLAALLETRVGVFDSSGGTPAEDKIKQPLLITTAHMHWDPEFSDVKLIQTMMLMSELKKVVEESYNSIQPTSSSPVDCNSIPIILCGDLNSLPESGVIEYLQTGKVPSNHIDFKELGYEACLQAFNCHKDSTHLTHKFKLGKAYEDNIMRHTNYTFDFKGMIDYIFFSRNYMNLLGVLGPMDENWFQENKVVGCPHPHIPSDHFSLFVEFEMPVPYPDIATILADDNKAGSSFSSGNTHGTIGSGIHRDNKR